MCDWVKEKNINGKVVLPTEMCEILVIGSIYLSLESSELETSKFRKLLQSFRLKIYWKIKEL